MRVLWLLALMVVPLVGAEANVPAGDLIVVGTLASEDVPHGAIPLSVIPGYVVPDAPAPLARRLLGAPGVERVAWGAPLERHALVVAAEGGVRTDLALGLTRADELAPLAGRGVTVAVLDSGIDATHPDLAGRVQANLRLANGAFTPSVGDTDGHGTHVAGIVAASGASSQGRWRGVAPEARLVGLDISGRFTTASAILAYDWLHRHHEEHGIRVVVNAWGRVPDGTGFDAEDPEIRAIERLVDDGVVVIFSASNRGPAPGTVSVEAQSPRVLTVGATDVAGLLMPYSGRGPVASGVVKPDVIAPGDAIVGLRATQTTPRDDDPDALHRVYSGTSQSAPHVGGIVALMLERDPTLSPERIADALRGCAVDLGMPGPDPETGAGLVDARDALRHATGAGCARDGVLVAGGDDLQQDEATLASAPRRGLLGFFQQPTLLWETSFAVKPGASALELELSGDAVGDLRAEAGRDGATEAAFTDSARLENPGAGVWTLRVYGALPATASATATARVTLPPHPERALEPEGSPPPSAAPATQPAGTWGIAAVGFLVGVALACVAVPLLRRPARDPYLEAGAPTTRER